MPTVFTGDKRKRIFIIISLFLLYFILQLCFVNDMWFGTDELDVFLGGKSIARGYTLYKDYCSQHMPVAYYFSAVFDLLGAKNVETQRIAYYAFFSCMWTIIYLKYKTVVNGKALLIFPIVQMSAEQTYDLGTQILCEHIVAIGAVMLLLEFYRYYLTREIAIKDCIFISISVFLMFGCTFVCVLGILAIGVGYSLQTLWFGICSIKKWKKLIIDTLKLFGIILVPWIVLGIIYVINGNLERVIYFVYQFNTDVYSKYAGGAYSSIKNQLIAMLSYSQNTYLSLLDSVWNGLVLFDFRIDGSRWCFYKCFLQLILMTVFVIHIIHRAIEKKIMLVITEIFYLFFLTFRGIFNFHETHLTALLSMITCIEMFELFNLVGGGQNQYGRLCEGQRKARLCLCL